MTLHPLMAISSVDGRYHRRTKELGEYLSEFGLIKYRIFVMIEYLFALSRHQNVPLRMFTEAECSQLRDLQAVTLADAQIIKDIETKGYGGFAATNHDVKACEFYLRLRFAGTSLEEVTEWIHFGSTSEDVNNAAYALMLRGALHKILLPKLYEINDRLFYVAKEEAWLAMLARTHGQSATPTTLGKEFRNFAERLHRQIDFLRSYRILVKFNSASGNYNALVFALPDVPWISFSQNFVQGHLNQDPRVPPFEVNLYTTQIEPHDTYAELFGGIIRANVILFAVCQDIWRYVSDDWLVQKVVQGEVGSSIMPHKVNPIDFENAEGNLGFANALLRFFGEKLPISRLQRDLSDSTVERGFGSAFGLSLVAYHSVMNGLGKISANKTVITEALNAHPEVLTDAYQTLMRRYGVKDPYALLKDLSRGQRITLEDLHAFVRGLNLPEEAKQKMLQLTPRAYTGLAPQLAGGEF
ncbi:MAG TPA: adenylosuccinate lyase [Candidatus Paceibacterota bacterium]|nr:adenylosuccinate lyase [Candidatus Paceibacterota bacterium]